VALVVSYLAKDVHTAANTGKATPGNQLAEMLLVNTFRCVLALLLGYIVRAML